MSFTKVVGMNDDELGAGRISQVVSQRLPRDRPRGKRKKETNDQQECELIVLVEPIAV
jgi:hypothetical protein